MVTLSERFGSAKRPERMVARQRPADLSDQEVAALGKLSEALEVVEQARGALYQFHRLSGRADLALQDAVDQLHAAGHSALATEISNCLVGRDVIDGRWTFELIDAYDEQYWRVFREVERAAREQVDNAPAHLLEAEMKHREQQPE